MKIIIYTCSFILNWDPQQSAAAVCDNALLYIFLQVSSSNDDHKRKEKNNILYHLITISATVALSKQPCQHSKKDKMSN